MKIKAYKFIFCFSLFIMFFTTPIFSQKGTEEKIQQLTTNTGGEGIKLEIEFEKGVSHYFPLIAIWVEDTSGSYLHPLYVAESIARGVFEHGKAEKGHWVKGEKLIPSALPYWGHQRGVKAEDSIFMPTSDNPLPDAYTGATPTSSFVLHTRTNDNVGNTFKILFEINQAWDWNEYWYNSKYPGNKEYIKSAQPALVYEATVDLGEGKSEYIMEPIGHSHPYGAEGTLFPDLSTLTTALKISEKIVVRIENE